jgi:hypothetical protein
MELKTKTVKLRILTAAKNMILTNDESYSSVGGTVYLGVNDSPDNWHEITEEEYNAIIAAQEAEAEAQLIDEE